MKIYCAWGMGGAKTGALVGLGNEKRFVGEKALFERLVVLMKSLDQ